MTLHAATVSSDFVDVVIVSNDDIFGVGLGQIGLRLTPRALVQARTIQDDAEATKVSPDYPQVVGQIVNSTQATPGSISVNLTRMARAKLSLVSIRTLYRLANRADGWRGAGSKALNSESLSSFLEFWTALLDVSARKEPSFALGPNGALIAEWHKNNKRHLDVEFLPDGQVYFGLISSKTVIDGMTSSAQLRSMLLSLSPSPLGWSDG